MSGGPSDTAPAGHVCVGAVAGAHGVRGGVRIKSFTEDPHDVGAYGKVTDEAGRRTFDIRVTGQAKGVVLARLSGIDSREAAEALKGLRLYVPRDRLPPPSDDEFYHADLIGLAVVDQAGAVIGEVRAVHDFGAGDLLEIAMEGRAPVLVPFTAEAVPAVDIAAGRLVIDPPPGLLDDEEVQEDLPTGPSNGPNDR